MSVIISEKIRDRTAKAAVIGLGYVGLPLATEMAKAGFQTLGCDLSSEKVAAINAGKNYVADIDDDLLAHLVREGKLRASDDFSSLAECDFISICVPTPLSKGKDPDMSFIVSAVSEVRRYLRSNQVIVLESTTYPGTTEELVLPMLEESGLQVGVDFHLAFSPERIDPGNRTYGIKNTPKIIGGVTNNCTEIAQSFYQTFVDQIVPVGSTRSAEMVKLLENTFRAINIGLANEIAIMCNHLNIDTWEVIDAASSKPFGFMPFYPGPGLGGHCIPIDPHYLVWKLKSMDYSPRFIQLADEINSSMPKLVLEKITSILNEAERAVRGSHVLILGIAYKQDIGDWRESPALDLIQMLHERGAVIDYHDPYIPTLKMDNLSLESVTLGDNLRDYDCVALLTNHSRTNLEEVLSKCRAFVDTRNATKHLRRFADKIVKL